MEDQTVLKDAAMATMQLCFTTILLAAAFSRQQHRRERRKAPYKVRARRGPLRKERLEWDYATWHDAGYHSKHPEHSRGLTRVANCKCSGT